MIFYNIITNDGLDAQGCIIMRPFDEAAHPTQRVLLSNYYLLIGYSLLPIAY